VRREQNAASKGARFGVHFTQIMSFSASGIETIPGSCCSGMGNNIMWGLSTWLVSIAAFLERQLLTLLLGFRLSAPALPPLFLFLRPGRPGSLGAQWGGSAHSSSKLDDKAYGAQKWAPWPPNPLLPKGYSLVNRGLVCKSV
jgi:hypothetical protein